VAITIIAMLEGAVLVGGATGKTQYRNAVMRSLKKMIESM